jgi:hypothetical protein
MIDLDSKSAKLLKRLLDALNACICSSGEVTSALAAVKEAGQQVELAVEITFKQVTESGSLVSDRDVAPLPDIFEYAPVFEYTPEDAQFLKSLGISDMYE